MNRKPLADWFELIRKERSTTRRQAMQRLAFEQHGGLAARLQKRYAAYLEPNEALGYIWEAIPEAADEWDPSLSAATTYLITVARRAVERFRGHRTFRAGVSVPIKGCRKYGKSSKDPNDVIDETDSSIAYNID